MNVHSRFPYQNSVDLLNQSIHGSGLVSDWVGKYLCNSYKLIVMKYNNTLLLC